MRARRGCRKSKQWRARLDCRAWPSPHAVAASQTWVSRTPRITTSCPVTPPSPRPESQLAKQLGHGGQRPRQGLRPRPGKRAGQTLGHSTQGADRGSGRVRAALRHLPPGFQLKSLLDFEPDIVVVALGENVPALVTEEARTKFSNSFTRLLTALKNSGKPAIFVRGCFWADKTKDDIMQKSCRAVGGVFVDISGLGKDESN